MPETTKNLLSTPAARSSSTNIDMDLTAIDDWPKRVKTDPFFAGLAEICARHSNLNAEAEKYLLANK